MFRFCAFALLLGICATVQPACAAAPDDLTPAQALADVRLAERALLALHPGLYHYNTPAEIDAEFKRTEAAVRAGASIATMYLELSRLAAAVRCGHTWTNPLNQSETVRKALFEANDKLPMRLRVVEGRLLVTASAVPQVSAGAEIVAIEGQTVAQLIAELLPLLRADGGNDGKRLSQIDTNENGGAMDRLLPILHPPVAGRYTLLVRHGIDAAASISVEAVSVQQRETALAAAGHAAPDDAWQLTIHDDLAIWTVPTFSFWRGEFDWRGFIDRSFAETRARHVKRLVIDLRRNEGGDDAVGRALLSHLISHPYTPPISIAETSFERVPYVLARYLDTWDFGFFDHTGQVERIADRRYRLLGLSEGGTPVVPAEPTFHGRVVALIGPQMSSAGFLIARDLRASHAALLVGQQTGGSLRGMNGGQLTWLTLPRSGVAIDIPLVAWIPSGNPADHGIVPDENVPQTFDDIARGIDVDMNAAFTVLEQDSRW